MSVQVRVLLAAVILAFTVVAGFGILTSASWESAGIWVWIGVLLACLTVLFVSLYRSRQQHR